MERALFIHKRNVGVAGDTRSGQGSGVPKIYFFHTRTVAKTLYAQDPTL